MLGYENVVKSYRTLAVGYPLGSIMGMKNVAIALLVLGAVLVTYAETRIRAFLEFSPNANSETAGFIVFRTTVVTPLVWGLVVIVLSVLCFWLARKKG